MGVALNRLDAAACATPVTIDARRRLPLVPVDGVLIEQVLDQPARERGEVHAGRHADRDRPPAADGRRCRWRSPTAGPGSRPARRPQIFEKFHRALGGAGAVRGVGLGLTICRGIVELRTAAGFGPRTGRAAGRRSASRCRSRARRRHAVPAEPAVD